MRKKIFAIIIMTILCLLCLLAVNANAAEVQATPENFTEVVASAEENDTIVLAEGTYNIGNLTLEKALTLQGAGKDATILEGTITTNANLTLQNLEITAEAASIITVNAPVTVNVENSAITDKGLTTGNTAGIHLKKGNADGATLNVTNSEIFALYGIWVNGANNTVNVTGSEVTGWAALDITYGSSADSLAKGNTVTVTNSTLTGNGVHSGPTNEYSNIVIGAQDGLKLNISGSTLTNTINSDNPEDLIAFGDAYLTSKNVMITIENSELINTDTKNGSAVFDVALENSNPENSNMIAISVDTTIETANGVVYNDVEGYITLVLSTIEGDVAITLPEGTVLTEDVLKPGEVEGYTFEGYFTDENYTTPFDYSALNEDTTLYAKFVPVSTEEPTEPETPTDPSEEPTTNEVTDETNTEENIENPQTGDNLIAYIATAVAAIAVLGVVIKKKMK